MAHVTVFVDDAVRGRLPAVCVKDGTPAQGRLAVSQTIGDGTRLGVAAVPPGWRGSPWAWLPRSRSG
ncbi:MAG: hypothetical protein ACRDY7_04335 [Acidimicrobiia bacterium]